MLLPYTLWSLSFGRIIQVWEKLASIRALVTVEFNLTNSLWEHCLPCGLVVWIRPGFDSPHGNELLTQQCYYLSMNAVEKKNCQVSESAVSTQLGVPFFCESNKYTADTFQYFK